MEWSSIWDIPDSFGESSEEEDSDDVIIMQSSLQLRAFRIESFSELNFHESVMKGLKKTGFFTPRKVQKYAFATMISYMRRANWKENVAVLSPNKSGKTTTGLIAALGLVSSPGESQSQVLVVCPTQESVHRAHDAAKALACCCPKITFFLAVSRQETNKSLRITENVIAGTPNKLQEYFNRKRLDVRNIKLMVIDEIDTSSRAHQANVSNICKQLDQTTCQMLVLSAATEKEDLVNFVRNMVRYPIFVQLLSAKRFSSNARRLFVVCCSFEEKMSVLGKLLDLRSNGQIVVFYRDKDDGKDIGEALQKRGGSVALLHSKLKAPNKNSILKDFEEQRKKVLVTTPAFAKRISGCSRRITTVLNYDLLTSVRNQHLDHDEYNKRTEILGNHRNGVVINIIDKRWEPYVEDEHGKKLQVVEHDDLERALLDDRRRHCDD